jgi:hypothetical protein
MLDSIRIQSNATYFPRSISKPVPVIHDCGVAVAVRFSAFGSHKLLSPLGWLGTAYRELSGPPRGKTPCAVLVRTLEGAYKWPDAQIS